MFSKIDEAMQRYVDDEILPGVSYQILKGSEIVHAGQVRPAARTIETRTHICVCSRSAHVVLARGKAASDAIFTPDNDLCLFFDI